MILLRYHDERFSQLLRHSVKALCKCKETGPPGLFAENAILMEIENALVLLLLIVYGRRIIWYNLRQGRGCCRRRRGSWVF
jgi:hypothetical protein